MKQIEVNLNSQKPENSGLAFPKLEELKLFTTRCASYTFLAQMPSVLLKLPKREL